VAERFGLTSENCPKHPSNCTDRWIESDFQRGVIYFILEDGNAEIGCVAMERAGEETCYLERLGVVPKERRKGYGRALVDRVISESKSFGAKSISIGIISEHEELREWYQRIGFVEGETKEFKHLPFLVTFMSFILA